MAKPIQYCKVKNKIIKQQFKKKELHYLNLEVYDVAPPDLPLCPSVTDLCTELTAWWPF